MPHSTTIHSRPAIAGGLIAASASTVLLVRDAITTGPTVDHFMMPVLVGLTVLAAHLGWQAARDWQAVAMPLLALAAFGSSLIVLETMGRRAEGRDSHVAEATARNQTRSDKLADLDRARQRLADAEKMVDLETRAGGCPDKRRDGRRSNCSDWKQRAEEVRSHIAVLEGELLKLGGEAPVDAKAKRIAAVLALAGVPMTAEAIEARVAVFDPFALPLFLEGLAVFLFGFGFGHAPRKATGGRSALAEGDTLQTSFPAAGRDPDGSGGPSRGRPMPAPVNENAPAVVKGEVIAWCSEFRERHGRPPSWSELRREFTLPKSTASVWRRQACG